MICRRFVRSRVFLFRHCRHILVPVMNRADELCHLKICYTIVQLIRGHWDRGQSAISLAGIVCHQPDGRPLGLKR